MKPLVAACAILLAAIACQKSSDSSSAEAPSPAATQSPATNQPDQKQADQNKTVVEQAGIPIYPGSQMKGLASSQISKDETHFNAVLISKDAPQKVTAYYKDQLKVAATQKGRQVQLFGKTTQGADFQIFVSPEDGGNKITIQGVWFKNSKPKP